MIYLFIFITTLFSPAPPAEKGGFKEGKYLLNQEASEFTWTGTDVLGVKSHTGSVEAESGYIVILNDQLSAVHLNMDLNTIESDQAKLDGHLKSADFFDVANFKDVTFVLEQSVPLVEGTNTVTGLVNIKGISKEETFTVEISKRKSTVTCTFSIILDRTKYGVNYGAPDFWDGMKDKAISNEISLEAVASFELQ